MPTFNVGAFVLGAPTSPRALVRHADLLTAYADGAIEDEREAYLSHFVFGEELQRYFAANRNSVAGFAGPCWCRWLVLDIDRPDLAAALADARRLVGFLAERYGTDPPVWFSGSKGFHVAVELVHRPPPSVTFPAVARTFAEALARAAGVEIDRAVYDRNHIIRLPNTRHPKTGLFKRRIDADDLFRLDIDGIRRHAAHPAGDGIPAVRSCPANLAGDWHEAGQVTARATEARDARRGACARIPDERAPRYLIEFLRFGVPVGERHTTLFRCAAWLTEQGAPPSLVHALLTEPGCDVGLMPKDVERQIRCGIEHAQRQRVVTDPRPDPIADPDAFEAWAIRHEDDPLPPGAMDFPFGALAPVRSEGGLA
jgi:hypothetical protein